MLDDRLGTWPKALDIGEANPVDPGWMQARPAPPYKARNIQEERGAFSQETDLGNHAFHGRDRQDR